MAPVVLPAPRPATIGVPATEPEFADVDDDQELILEELTREQVLDWRNRAAADHQLVFDHIDQYGELSAQRLFTRAFVAQVQRLSGLGHLDRGYTPGGRRERRRDVRRRPDPGRAAVRDGGGSKRTAAARRRSEGRRPSPRCGMTGAGRWASERRSAR